MCKEDRKCVQIIFFNMRGGFEISVSKISSANCCPKIEKVFNAVLCLKGADAISNSVDPD